MKVAICCGLMIRSKAVSAFHVCNAHLRVLQVGRHEQTRLTLVTAQNTSRSISRANGHYLPNPGLRPST